MRSQSYGRSARSSAENVVFPGMKVTGLVNFHVTVSMQSYPSRVLDRASVKSMVIVLTRSL
jgi:hypothetical protein